MLRRTSPPGVPIERRGAAVMPFDQNATMHQFTPNASGGVETITANDPKDTNQITLIQEHLAHERDLFAAGNFSDPMAVHGMTMPGIQDLQRGAAAGRITITYAAMANGARLATPPAIQHLLTLYTPGSMLNSWTTVPTPWDDRARIRQCISADPRSRRLWGMGRPHGAAGVHERDIDDRIGTCRHRTALGREAGSEPKALRIAADVLLRSRGLTPLRGARRRPH